MERDENVIDLGAATAETKGSVGPGQDDILRRKLAGISDD
jgi:hypothetical protein